MFQNWREKHKKGTRIWEQELIKTIGNMKEGWNWKKERQRGITDAMNWCERNFKINGVGTDEDIKELIETGR